MLRPTLRPLASSSQKGTFCTATNHHERLHTFDNWCVTQHNSPGHRKTTPQAKTQQGSRLTEPDVEAWPGRTRHYRLTWLSWRRPLTSAAGRTQVCNDDNRNEPRLHFHLLEEELRATHRAGEDANSLNFHLPRYGKCVHSLQLHPLFVLQHMCPVHSHLNNTTPDRSCN